MECCAIQRNGSVCGKQASHCNGNMWYCRRHYKPSNVLCEYNMPVCLLHESTDEPNGTLQLLNGYINIKILDISHALFYPNNEQFTLQSLGIKIQECVEYLLSNKDYNLQMPIESLYITNITYDFHTGLFIANINNIT